MKSAAVTSALAATVCCGSVGEGDMVLTDEGYIRIAGGCECYTEATIRFAPAPGDNVWLELDNAGAWFYAGNKPRESFEADLAADEAAAFFGELKAVLDHPKAADTAGTRAAVVEIYLPLESGTLETTWRELDMKYDVNPLVDFLQVFVEQCGEEA